MPLSVGTNGGEEIKDIEIVPGNERAE